jgi:carbamoyltransferase
MMSGEWILGIWDGHDAGAALLRGDQIIFAINEERLSRRKLDVGFPRLSIGACLDYASLSAADIRRIAASTTDPAKTLTRLLPHLKEEYYLIRRRKIAPRRLDPAKKRFKYRFTELAPNLISRSLSRSWLNRRLREMGFRDFTLSLIDHHTAHAASAAFCSGFGECLVMTIDGVGDGLSGSILEFRDGRMRLIKALPAGVSLGIFFEHVTNLMNMRELEDEGKVMALANYAYPIADDENPLMAMIETRGLDLLSGYSSTDMFREMKKILWRYPSEQFAAMAQRVLEQNMLSLVRTALMQTGQKKIALAGGVFSNIKMNMKIAELPEVERIYVFPHMGDGGLALGAAMAANHERQGVSGYRLDDLCLGPAFPNPGKDGRGGDPGDGSPSWRDSPALRITKPADPVAEAAQMILAGEVILWFQGRMEIGPRSLGGRSILARPDDRRIKDRLNLLLKKRVWYQPFCPSMLIEDAPDLLYTQGQDIRDNRFMTMGFRVREDRLQAMEGVINVDWTCRPQFVGAENPRYRSLLLHLKKDLGIGVVLNTSFNIHGEPVVCKPEEAVDVLRRTGIRYLFMEDMLVENLIAKPL